MPSAFIPLPAPVALPDAPSVSIGVVRAPTADNRGLLAGVADLAAGNRQPMIPLEPFMAPGRGLQQLGAGIREGADQLYKLGIARAEAQNDLDVAGAQNMLAVKFAEFEGRMQSMPPQQWQEAFTPIGEQAVTEALQDERLSPSARRRIELYGKRWLSEAAVRVMTAATVETGKRAEAETFANISRSLMTGDVAGAERQLAEIKTSGKPYIDPRRIVQAEGDILEARKEAARNAEYATIQADPERYLAENSGIRSGETTTEHAWRINRAKEAERGQFHTRTESIADLFADPNLTADRMEQAIVGLRPAEAAKWRSAFAERQQEALQSERAKPENINALWGALDDAVQSFDRNAPNAREQYTAIRSAAMALPEGWRQHITRALDGKFSAEPPEPAAELSSEIDAAIDGHYKAGAFGPVTRPVKQGYDPVTQQWETAQDGKSYIKTRDWKEDLPEDQIQGPRAAKAALKLRMKALLKAHPEWNNDPQKAFDELNSARERQRAKGAPSINFAPAPKSSLFPQGNLPPDAQQPFDLPASTAAPSGAPSVSLVPNEPPPDVASGSGAIWVSDGKNGSTEVTPMKLEDVQRWRESGDKKSRVWDLEAHKWVEVPTASLIPGRHAMPTSLFP